MAAVQLQANVAPASWHWRPLDLGVEAPDAGVVGMHREVGHTDDVRRGTIAKIVIRLDPYAVCSWDLPPVGGNDVRHDPLPARHAGGNEPPVTASGAKKIVHRVDDRGGDLRVGENCCENPRIRGKSRRSSRAWPPDRQR